MRQPTRPTRLPAANIRQAMYAVGGRPLCSRYVAGGVPSWLSGATAS